MEQVGMLLGIAIKPAPKAPMGEASAATITKEAGVGNDSRGAPGRRQVTVLSLEGWEAACAEMGVQLPWTARRANLFIDGIVLRHKIGYDLRVGSAVLTITGETRPCCVMEDTYVGLRAALEPEWRGGVTCLVIQTGEVEVGCKVVLDRNLIRQIAVVTRMRARRLLKGGRSMVARVALQLGWNRTG